MDEEAAIDVRVLDREAIMFITGEWGTSAYILYDIARARAIIETHDLEGLEGVEEVLRDLEHTILPKTGTRREERFEGSAVELLREAAESLDNALERKNPLPRVPDASMCAALGHNNDCVLLGFRNPEGRHQLLVIENGSAMRRVLDHELAWLDPVERAQYAHMFADYFPTPDDDEQPQYVTLEGDVVDFLNTGLYWIDIFETETELGLGSVPAEA